MKHNLHNQNMKICCAKKLADQANKLLTFMFLCICVLGIWWCWKIYKKDANFLSFVSMAVVIIGYGILAIRGQTLNPKIIISKLSGAVFDLICRFRGCSEQGAMKLSEEIDNLEKRYQELSRENQELKSA